MSELQSYKLGELASFINGRAYSMPEMLSEGKYRIVRVGNFTGKDQWYYSDMELDSDKYCEKGDLLYKWACTFGPEYWTSEKAIFHYHIWKIIPDETIIDKDYLYYLLKWMTPIWLRAKHGSTMVHITKEIMENNIVVIPTNIKTQKKVASTLKYIDDKISNNNTINAELEALAKTIYDYWFLQFEFPNEEGLPYKSSGGKMVWSEGLKREIPEGWEVKKISDYMLINYSTWDKKTPQIQYLDTSNLTRNVSDTLVSLDLNNDIIPSRAQRKIHKNDILYSTVRPEQEHYGILKSCPDNLVASTGFVQLSCKFGSQYNEIFYHILINPATIQYLDKLSKKSSYPSVRPDEIGDIIVVLPKSIGVVEKLAQRLSNIYQLIDNKQRESKELAALRDWLLPMLMNGQVGFKDVE